MSVSIKLLCMSKTTVITHTHLDLEKYMTYLTLNSAIRIISYYASSVVFTKLERAKLSQVSHFRQPLIAHSKLVCLLPKFVTSRAMSEHAHDDVHYQRTEVFIHSHHRTSLILLFILLIKCYY